MVFRDARPEDDLQLSQLMAKPMPGKLSLSFCREPSFLDSCSHCGPPRQVLTAISERQVEALCTYFPWTYWVEGKKTRVWTVADFRARDGAAYRGITGRGWTALRERLKGEPALISLIEENPNSLKLFSKARPGWPRLHKLADLKTLILPLWATPKTQALPGFVSPSPNRLVEFLKSQAPHDNFSPCLEAQDIGRVTPSADNFVACFDGSEVLACGALWDPGAYRQVKVAAYAGAYARLRKLGLLPPPGSQVSLCFAAFLSGSCSSAVARVFRELVRRAKDRGAQFLVWGGDRSSPLPFPSYWPRFTYRSSLFQLLWDSDVPLKKGARKAAYEVAWL